MTAVEEQLREEVIALRGILAQLQGGEDQVSQYRTAFGLRPRCARVLALLVNTRRPISAEAIYASVFEHDNGEGPILESVKVAISNIRCRTRPLGAPERSIPVAFGLSSYSLTPEFRSWLSSYLQPVEIAA